MRLSVVIPCYNAEGVIGEQLLALTRQDWDEPWEVVVSDNGSTDSSREVVEGFLGRIPSLRIVDSSAARGEAHARNAGIKEARGELILNCDADDVVADNFVPAMARALEAHDFVACGLEEKRLNEPWISESWKNAQKEGLLGFSPSFLPFGGGGTLGFKRSVFEAVGGFDPTFTARTDNDFCWRVQLKGIPLHFVPETVVHYRYPVEYSQMYRQSKLLAEYQVLLYKRYQPLGMPQLSLRRALRGNVSWRRIIGQLRHFRGDDRVRRARFVRDLGHKVGRLKGSIRYRALAL